MKQIMRFVILFAIPMLTMLYACSSNQGETNTPEESDLPTGSSTQLQPNTAVGTVVGSSWIKGKIYLPASEHSLGLILIEHGDRYNSSSWIPYSRHSSTDGAILRDTTVYFRLLEVSLGDLGVFLAADSLRKALPTTVMSISEVLQLIRGKSIYPHDLFPDHAHGSGQHVPGHIIRDLTQSRSVEVVWGSTSSDLQVEQYELVELQYKNNVRETVFVPKGWVTALSDTSKHYYFDFYTATLKDDSNAERKVLRSYTVEHSHAGHVVNVTLTPR